MKSANLLIYYVVALSVALGGGSDRGARAEAPKLYPDAMSREVPKPPWLRRRLKPKTRKPTGQGLLDISLWPAEPPAPARADVDPERLAGAIRQVCGWMPTKRPGRWTEWILESSDQFKVDPFLVAAVVYEMSLCNPKFDNALGVGLGSIQTTTHGGYIKKRVYRYHVLEDGNWRPRALPMKRHLFYKRSLEVQKSAIYFIAGILSVYKAQWPALATAFGSVPHRHYISHFVWGDKVRGADDEDRILNARRRLLRLYEVAGGGEVSPALGRWKELAISSPLWGIPRKLTSAMGDDRDGGVRRHKGVDFAGNRGEAVRAIADGVVTLAGVDYKKGPTKNMSAEAASAVKSKEMALGGRLVMLRHEGGLTSAYMHLDDYVVARKQRVKRGDIIGHVGRSGMKQSAAHLHFELRFEGHHLDPVPYLGPLVFHPDLTWRGRRIAAERERLRRRKRRARRK